MARNSIEGMAMKRISGQFEVIDKVSCREGGLASRNGFLIQSRIGQTMQPTRKIDILDNLQLDTVMDW